MTTVAQALRNCWRKYERQAEGLGKAMREFYEIDNGDTFPNICVDLLEKHVGRERLLVYGKERMKKWVVDMMMQQDADSNWEEEIEEEVESYFEEAENTATNHTQS